MKRNVRSSQPRFQFLGFVCMLLFALTANAAQIIYLVSNNASPETDHQVEAAARFYGLAVNRQAINSPAALNTALTAVHDGSAIGIIIQANALSLVPQQRLLSDVAVKKHPLPILIAGINAQTDAVLLKAWSSGMVMAGATRHTSQSLTEQIGPANAITRQLAGSTLPLHTSTLDSLVLDPSRGDASLISARLDQQSLPVFAHTAVGGHDIFFAADMHSVPPPVSADPFRLQGVFATLAAPMMYMRYAGGDTVWHSTGNYANFTIDDLWFREPYGHVNYNDLLAQSQQHNFHSTIAFIPWNYDRSQPAVAALFRAHPDRLSICVHGNDHIHQEFGPLSEHPLATQARNIDQSLVRMNRFTELTEIPFDRVMVFPHSVSPEKTFAELKRANYLGTANSLNVPSDATAPADDLFVLRPTTLAFGNFASLRRYSAETDIPRAQLAIDAFLGNPMLFYAHESYFATGADAFNGVADTANRLQPGLQWRSLGEIMQHLYVEKKEDDGSVSIQSFSPSLRVHNDQARDITYHLQKEEDFHLPITVLVDGRSSAYQRQGDTLNLVLPVAHGATRTVTILYGTPGATPKVQLASYSVFAAPIRYLSDFRDNFVSNTALGRWFIHSYVDFGTRWRIGTFVLIAVLAFVTWLHQRSRRVGRKPQPVCAS